MFTGSPQPEKGNEMKDNVNSAGLSQVKQFVLRWHVCGSHILCFLLMMIAERYCAAWFAFSATMGWWAYEVAKKQAQNA